MIMKSSIRRVAAPLFLMLAVLAFAGCKRDEGQVPELQGGAVDARPQVEGFALTAAGRGTHEGQLAIELEFSQPLAAGQSFDELLVVTGAKGEAVKGSWVLDDEAKTLHFPYVEASQDYSVLLRAGLAAADGKTLGKDDTRKVNTGPVEPAVGFASQGSVLPARDTRGLPVVSVNVPEVDVEFLRVRDSEVANFFVGYQRGGRRGGWELGDSEWQDRIAISKIADSVYLNRFVLGVVRTSADSAICRCRTSPSCRSRACISRCCAGSVPTATTTRRRSSSSATSACTCAPTASRCSYTRPRSRAATRPATWP